jgi:hypothetical protein
MEEVVKQSRTFSLIYPRRIIKNLENVENPMLKCVGFLFYMINNYMKTIANYFTKSNTSELLIEMPWVSGVNCPKCGNTFEADLQMEKWPMSQEDRKECMNEYYRYKVLPFVCQECSEPLIYDLAKKKTFSYNRIFKHLKPSARKYVEKIRDLVMPNIRSEVSIMDSLTFKSFSDTLDILQEGEQSFSTKERPLIGLWILPSGKVVEAGFSGHYTYVKRYPEAFGFDPDEFESVYQHTEVLNMAFRQGGIHVFVDPNHAMEVQGLNEYMIRKHLTTIIELQRKHNVPENKVNVSIHKPTFDILKLSQFIRR